MLRLYALVLVGLAAVPALAASGIGRAEPPASQPAEKAVEVAKQLKAEIKTFRLELLYNGQEDKPFYGLILSVPPIGYDRSNPFYRLARITEAQAEKIIDHLAEQGFLDEAFDLRAKPKRPPPAMPGYVIRASTQGIRFQEDLGWGLPMLKRLDGLRKVLDGDAAKGMDLLLARLTGLREQWEKEAAEQPNDVTSAMDGETATLAQALEDWIVLLEASDVETAQQRWARDSTAMEGMKRWWARLEECHKQHNYRKWLEAARQIGDATEFKVGGHDYGHMHVDWKKTEQGWRIANVWICR
jgi:hypothetical protein